MKIEKQIEKYKNLISYFTAISKKIKNNEQFLKTTKTAIIDFVNQLYILEKKDKVVYERMLETASIDKNMLIEAKTDEVEIIPEEKENSNYVKYMQENVYNNETIAEGLNRLTEKLIEDLDNPNDTLINVWVKNYKEFVEKNDLEEKYMIEYMKNLFEEKDIDKKYVDVIEEMYQNANAYEELSKEQNEEEKQIEMPKEKETKEINEPKVENKPIDENEPKVENKQTDENEPKVENKPTDENEVKEENKPTDENEVKEESKPNVASGEGLKIISTKQTTYSKTEKIGLGVLALACLSTPFITPAVTIGFITHRLFKNYMYRHKRLDQFLEENGLTINENKELIDENGQKVTEETVGKERYEAIKHQLISIGGMKNKLIKTDYKKSKLLQTMMNLNPVKKLKKAFTEKKNEDVEIVEDLEEQTIKRGMGRF